MASIPGGHRGSRSWGSAATTTNRRAGLGTGVVVGPLIICLLIFLGFCVIMIVITYSFRVRSRCLATDTRRRSVTSSNLHRGSFSQGDLPPSYSSIIPPPSYEQATVDVAALSSSSASANNRQSMASTSGSTAPLVNRYSTISSTSSVLHQLPNQRLDGGPSTEMSPYMISPGMSSSESYGSILTRSFILTPSDHAPSLTDLTVDNLHRKDEDFTTLPMTHGERY